MKSDLITYLNRSKSDAQIKREFMERIHKGNFTRDEDSFSHICVYFAAYEYKKHEVFIGKHIKSGLWLFNGGHLDKGETIEMALYREMNEEWGVIKKLKTLQPSLFTITPIENPQKQICRKHFDVWFFVPFLKDEFSPDPLRLSKEFFEWGWKSVPEANTLITDKASRLGLTTITSLF